jgi:serine/threonine-protein kinase
MIPTVTLTVDNGKLEGEEYVFDSPQVCAIGREADCAIHLPGDDEFLNVSRHHCVLHLNPPDVRVCDLSSLNGTYVNDMRIEGSGGAFEDAVPLMDGDKLRVGHTTFRISVNIPMACSCCGLDLGAFDVLFLEDEGDAHFCAACRDKEASSKRLPRVYST